MASDSIVDCELDKVAIMDLATEFIKRDKEETAKKKQDGYDHTKIRASMSGGCPRALGYALLGAEPQPLSAHQLFTFWQGHALGDAMTLILKRMDWADVTPIITEDGQLHFTGNTEERVESENFQGSYDVFTNPLKKVVIAYEDREGNQRSYETYRPTTPDDPEGKRYLLDFKTMTDRVGFFWRDGDKPALKTPASGGNQYYPAAGCIYPGKFSTLKGIPTNYWMQLHIYARLKQADGLMLVVMGRDVESKICYAREDHLFNFPVKVFTTRELHQETLDALDKHAEYMYDFTSKGELPPRPIELEISFEEHINKGKNPNKHYGCGNCSYNHLCRSEYFSKKPGIEELRPFALINQQE